jgi:hypothetical protein
VLHINTVFSTNFGIVQLSKSKMASSILYPFYILVWTLCVLPSEASWLRRADTSHQPEAWQPEAFVANSFPSSSSPFQSYTFSVPTPRVIEPNLISQGMAVSSIIPLYEVCNTPGLQKRSCSIVFKTIVTTTCSTVLTYAFTQATISDCSQNITFSTRSSYSLATATLTATTTPAPAFPSSVTTYVQSIVSYYIAPWQSLAANKPSNVTVLVCEYDFTGASSCTTIPEVWIVYTKYVPVITTSTLIIWTTLASVRFLNLPSMKDADLLACRASSRPNRKHNSRRRSAIYLYRNHLLVDDSEQHDFDLNHSTNIDFDSNSHNYEHVAREDYYAHFEFCNSYS